jgi:hypothetical protein
MESPLGNHAAGRIPELVALEVIVTGGLCLWLLSNAIVHFVDYWRARRAVRQYINLQPVGGDDPGVPTPLELRRAAIPRTLSFVLAMNIVLQLVVSAMFAFAAYDFVSGRAATGDRWAQYAFLSFAVLWFLFVLADPWVPWVPGNALERRRLTLVMIGIAGFAMFSLA